MATEIISGCRRGIFQEGCSTYKASKWRSCLWSHQVLQRRTALQCVCGNSIRHSSGEVPERREIQKNIRQFGGDSSKVTIFGQSAGGAAVHHLLLSKTTKGLFHRAISQSGSALGAFANDLNPKENAVKLATHLNCSRKASDPSGITSEEILECLKNMPMEQLNKAQFSNKTSWPSNLKTLYYSPTIEPVNPVTSLTPFHSEPPVSILSRKHSPHPEIPWMVGSTEDEGALFAGWILSNPNLLKEMNSDWDQVTANFDYGQYLRKEEQTQISQKMKRFYFGDKPVSTETRVALRNLFTDEMVLHGLYRAAMETASLQGNSSVYLYQCAHKGPLAVMAMAFQIKGEEAKMVGHGDELQHLFDIDVMMPGLNATDAIKEDSVDEEFSKNLVRMWASFAIHGEPKHCWGDAAFKKWNPISKRELAGIEPLRWLRIDRNPSSVEISQTLKDRMQFWEDVWNDYLTPVLQTKYES